MGHSSSKHKMIGRAGWISCASGALSAFEVMFPQEICVFLLSFLHTPAHQWQILLESICKSDIATAVRLVNFDLLPETHEPPIPRSATYMGCERDRTVRQKTPFVRVWLAERPNPRAAATSSPRIKQSANIQSALRESLLHDHLGLQNLCKPKSIISLNVLHQAEAATRHAHKIQQTKKTIGSTLKIENANRSTSPFAAILSTYETSTTSICTSISYWTKGDQVKPQLKQTGWLESCESDLDSIDRVLVWLWH